MSANPDDTDAFSTVNMCTSSDMLWSFAISACIDALKQTICIGNAGDKSSSYSRCRASALCNTSLFCANTSGFNTAEILSQVFHCEESLLQLSCYCVNCAVKDVDASGSVSLVSSDSSPKCLFILLILFCSNYARTPHVA